MAINYTWDVSALEYVPELNGFSDVVITVKWEAVAKNGDQTTKISGQSLVDLNEDDEFTPFADLTKEQVLGWVWAGLGENGKSLVEGNLENHLVNMNTSPVITQTPPWA
jgi:hypothetical protein